MKRLLFLYFLVLSPLLFGQNSYQSNFDEFKNYPVFNQGDPISFSERNLVVLDKDYTNIINNNWLLNPIKSTKENNEFTSLLLKKQLEELDYTTPFQLSHNPTLERFIRVYLNDRKESISKLMDRATYYFPIFETYLDKYDLPLEIKYLAVIESALKPNAKSPAGAKGLWQFMLATGKQYDLQVNSYVDERFDPLKSTEAACKYLSDLYKMFDDWDLALAAYNSGPGNVRKAIKRAGGKTNYWEIRQYLPQETRGYLPAFYATYYIFEYAKTHHLKPKNSELTYFEIDTIQVKEELTFTRIQEIIPIKSELLKALNPQYKREVIPFSKSKKYVLTLPKNLTNDFIENEKYNYQTNSKEVTSTKRIDITKYNSYIVQTGDNLNKIAAKHHITITQLKVWNGLQTDYLITGQRLVITNKKITQSLTKIEIQKSNISTNNFETYIVKKGDTLFNISKKYTNISIIQIRKWNKIEDARYLKPGTKLKIIKS